MKKWCLLLMLMAVFSPFPAMAFEHEGGSVLNRVLPQINGDYIVLFREGVAPYMREQLIVKEAGRVKYNYRNVVAAAAQLTPSGVGALTRDSNVLAVVPDRAVFTFVKPAGKGKPQPQPAGQVVPEGVKRIGASPGGLSFMGNGVGIAVVDTGVNLVHADLQPVTDGYSAFGGSADDDNGHGTHVAGIAAARNNSLDVVGVAPEAALYAVKVLDASGYGSDSTVMAGLDWIYSVSDGDPQIADVSPRIKVVNMSLGRSGSVDDNPALRASVSNLYRIGIAVVVAAGNDPNKEVTGTVPASYPEVLAIASASAIDGANQCNWYRGTIKADTASYFTTDGAFDASTKTGVTISAPGEDKEDINKACFILSSGILSTKLGGGTTRMSGTSMASPHAAGVAALLIGKNPLLQPEEVRSKLRLGADRVGSAPIHSPSSAYSYDGQMEGILYAPGALSY